MLLYRSPPPGHLYVAVQDEVANFNKLIIHNSMGHTHTHQ